MRHKIVILLTACIHPNGMCLTALKDTDERKKQYIDALKYYLRTTELPIVFVENTATDLSPMFTPYMQSGRLEYLTFDGNNYPKELGKGYGEAEIIGYAMRHSTLLKTSTYLLKITGRIIVTNINSIAQSFILKLMNNCVRFDFPQIEPCFQCAMFVLSIGLEYVWKNIARRSMTQKAFTWNTFCTNI